MLLVELTGATSEVGLLRWIFIPVSWAASSRLPFLMGVWGVGAQQTSPQTKYVRPPAAPPTQSQPDGIRFRGLFSRNEQIWLVLAKMGTGWRQTRRELSAGIVAAPARHLLVSEWHRLVNELSVG